MTNKITVNGFSLTVMEDHEEPLIHDLELAKKLGFIEPKSIRKLIKRHLETVEREFGTIITVRDTVSLTDPPSKGGPKATHYYLNEEQALFIVTKSDTELSNKITAQVIKVYKAWRKERNAVTTPTQTIIDPITGQQRKVTAYDPPVTRGELVSIIKTLTPGLAKEFMDENKLEEQFEKFIIRKMKNVLKVLTNEVDEVKSTALNAEENVTLIRETLRELKKTDARQDIVLKRLTEEVTQLRAAQEKTDRQVSVFKKQFTAIKEDIYKRLDVHRNRLNIHKKQIADFKETLGLNFEKVRRQFKGKKPH